MCEYDFFIRRLRGYAVTIVENVDGRTLGSFKSGGKVKRVLYPSDAEGLCETIYTLVSAGEPYYITGNGTNLLVPDDGYDGTAVSLKGMRTMYADGETLYASGGVNLSSAARLACENGLSGLEFAAEIPATIGGAVAMNAGAFGTEIADKVCKIDVLNGTSVEMYDKSEFEFGYRDSAALKRKLVVIGAKFVLKDADKSEIIRLCGDYSKRRSATQPREPCIGSVFKNPVGKSAGWYVESAGLKGVKTGGAEISSLHANFIVNKGGATTADYLNLMDCAAERVQNKFGITLVPEVRVLGE